MTFGYVAAKHIANEHGATTASAIDSHRKVTK
jgi:hypothetical protein